MTALADLELPSFDYLDPELRGARFHDAMAELAEQGWLATMPLGCVAVDREVPARCKVALVALVAYLASPIDLVPDFLPVIGVLDDAIVVALTLRWIVRVTGPDRVRRHWRGSARGLELVLRVAYRPGG